MADFEIDNQERLATMEFAIAGCFGRHPDLTDHDVEEAINAVLPQFEPRNRDTSGRVARLNSLAREVYEKLLKACGVLEAPNEQISACLKRIRKSVQFWRRDGGLRGYLNFINQNI